MPKPTAKEIDTERKALKHLKRFVPHRTRYGVDNWAMIGAQIQVLGMNFSYEEIDQAWPGPDETGDPECRGAAQDARYWMDGKDIISPTQSWAPWVLPERQSAKSRI